MRVQNSPALSPPQGNSSLAPPPQHCEKDTHSVTLLLHLHSCWSLPLMTVFLQQTSQHQYFSDMNECRDHRDDMNLCLSDVWQNDQTWTRRLEGPNTYRLREVRREEEGPWAKMLTNIQDGIVHIETGNVTEQIKMELSEKWYSERLLLSW